MNEIGYYVCIAVTATIATVTMLILWHRDRTELARKAALEIQAAYERGCRDGVREMLKPERVKQTIDGIKAAAGRGGHHEGKGAIPPPGQGTSGAKGFSGGKAQSPMRKNVSPKS